jgi:hypothetical protein
MRQTSLHRQIDVAKELTSISSKGKGTYIEYDGVPPPEMEDDN